MDFVLSIFKGIFQTAKLWFTWSTFWDTLAGPTAPVLLCTISTVERSQSRCQDLALHLSRGALWTSEWMSPGLSSAACLPRDILIPPETPHPSISEKFSWNYMRKESQNPEGLHWLSTICPAPDHFSGGMSGCSPAWSTPGGWTGHRQRQKVFLCCKKSAGSATAEPCHSVAILEMEYSSYQWGNPQCQPGGASGSSSRRAVDVGGALISSPQHWNTIAVLTGLIGFLIEIALFSVVVIWLAWMNASLMPTQPDWWYQVSCFTFWMHRHGQQHPFIFSVTTKTNSFSNLA